MAGRLIFEKPMTGAERVRRHREKKRALALLREPVASLKKRLAALEAEVCILRKWVAVRQKPKHKDRRTRT